MFERKFNDSIISEADMWRRINEDGRRNTGRPIYSFGFGETRGIIGIAPKPADERKTLPANPNQVKRQPQLVPTADDFANLFFCESSEEEEARATLAMATIKDDEIPNAASIPKQSCQRRRCVTFGGTICITHHLGDVCPSSATWLSRHELELFRSSAQDSIHNMRNDIMGKSADYKDRCKFRAKMVDMEKENDSSIRGLEHKIFRRKQTRQMLIEDVLTCQAHAAGLASFGHFMDTRELLAKVSLDRSRKAKSIALFDAREDYREAQGDLSSDIPVSPPTKRRKKQVRHVSLH